jgi:LytTr DNA-binding domain
MMFCPPGSPVRMPGAYQKTPAVCSGERPRTGHEAALEHRHRFAARAAAAHPGRAWQWPRSAWNRRDSRSAAAAESRARHDNRDLESPAPGGCAAHHPRGHPASRQVEIPGSASRAQRIPNSALCRVHKSYAVAIDKIESIERDRIRIGQALIPISASYRDKLYSVIGYR